LRRGVGNANKFFESMTEFKYFGRTVTNQFHSGRNYEHIEFGEVSYHSVQKLLSSSLLSRNLNTKISKMVVLPVVLYGCKTLSHTLRKERILRVFKNRVSRRMCIPKRREVLGG
jgi:hypothetical protein